MENEARLFLLDALAAEVKATPDTMFDYRVTSAKCGCLLPAVARLLRTRKNIDVSQVNTVFGLNGREAAYLAGFSAPTLDMNARHFEMMSAAEAKGKRGKREALRRIRRVRANYA